MGPHLPGAVFAIDQKSGVFYALSAIAGQDARARHFVGDWPMRGILAFVFLLFFTAAAMAHDAPSGWKYDPYCCNGDGETGDCQMIPARTVTIVPGGYRVTLYPGDHRYITHAHIFMLPQRKTMHSPDGAYHLCLFPDENTPRCFYAPDMSY
jgi:hypothetical protein